MVKKLPAIDVEFYDRNLSLFTRQSGELSVKNQKILKREFEIPSIRKGAVPAAKNEETSNIYMVANPSIREGAVFKTSSL